MIKIAIVDDNDNDILLLTEHINKYNSEHESNITFDVYTDGAMLVESTDKVYSIIIMDIEMPLLDGMEAAAEIRKTDEDVIIIFVTNMAQHAIKGYEVGALDYLLKPISYFSFSQCLGKAISRMQKSTAKHITVRVNRGVRKINVADIMYIESQKNLLIYHTINEELMTYGTIKSAEAQMKGLNFSRGNSGFLINLRHVDAIKDGCAIVKGVPIQLSRSRKSDFKDSLISYIEEMTK